MKKIFNACLFGAINSLTLFCLLITFAGCSTLFTPQPNPGGTNLPPVIAPAQPVVDVVRQVGTLFGPVGSLGSVAVIAALQAIAYVLQRKNTSAALAAHEATFHDPVTDPYSAAQNVLNDHLAELHQVNVPIKSPPATGG